MPPERPLLTIAIPTYNRSRFLGELLGLLIPQLENEPSVELLISDNASPDDTAEVVMRFCQNNPRFRTLRNAENIGSDANFLQCFREARGRYVWLVGDDDILVPGAIPQIVELLRDREYDLVFVRPHGFSGRFNGRPIRDRFRRTAAVVRDTRLFADIAGIMLTFISAVIVNKQRFENISAPDPAKFIDTGLIQFGWTLPLLANCRLALIVFGGLVAGRSANSGGYSLIGVFGVNLSAITSELLAERQDLARQIINNALRCWFPSTILSLRENVAGDFLSDDYHAILRPLFAGNFRYLLLVYPVIKAPLWVARLYVAFQRMFLLKAEAVVQMARLTMISREGR